MYLIGSRKAVHWLDTTVSLLVCLRVVRETVPGGYIIWWVTLGSGALTLSVGGSVPFDPWRGGRSPSGGGILVA